MSAEAIEFRGATSQEIGAIALLVVRAHAHRDGEPLPTTVDDSRTLDLQGYLHERISRPDVWTYVAASSEGIAGFALGYPDAGQEASTMAADTEYLSFLMVEPDAWGKGIASRLLDLAADRARHDGRRRLALWTRDENNDHARGVYEHKGFALTGLTRESQHGRQVEYRLDL